MFGDDYEEVMKKAEENRSAVDPEKERLEIKKREEEFRKTLTLEIALQGKAEIKGYEVKEVFYSMTLLNRLIKLSSSRYNDEPKSHLIRNLDAKIRTGEPFVKDISTGSCSIMNNLGGWSYMVVMDKDKQLWLVDFHLARTIYKMKRVIK
jgi:hypothetical protein